MAQRTEHYVCKRTGIPMGRCECAEIQPLDLPLTTEQVDYYRRLAQEREDQEISSDEFAPAPLAPRCGQCKHGFKKHVAFGEVIECVEPLDVDGNPTTGTANTTVRTCGCTAAKASAQRV
jgi:hypothetical protein